MRNTEKFIEVTVERADALESAGAWAQAAAAWRAACTVAPDHATWLRRLGSAQAAAGETAAALRWLGRALAVRPDDAAGHRLLAAALLGAGRPAEALGVAREAAFLAPFSPQAARLLAEASIAVGDPLQALEVLDPALRRADPRDPERALLALRAAEAWAALGEAARAVALLDGLGTEAEAEVVRQAAVLRGALQAGAGADRAAYVRALFDRYADRFEDSLVGRLRYAVPAALPALLARAVHAAPGSLDILDVGCGTGLAAPALRPLARHLAGIDLSPRMVAKAAAGGLYDVLESGDGLARLQASPGAWDVVAAADVLPYFDRLEPLFDAVGAALRPGGWFVASAERTDVGDVTLLETRRYAQSRAHVEACAAAAGLVPVVLDDFVPRWEAGGPLPGLLMVLRRDP